MQYHSRNRYEPNIVDEVFQRVYIGSSDAEDDGVLARHGITHIVNCISHQEKFEKDGMVYLNLRMDDLPSYRCIEDCETSFCFIEDSLRGENNRVLIHCQLGISRSCAVCTYFLMKHLHVTRAAAYKMIRVNRPRVQMNSGFVRQLDALNDKL